MIYLLIVSLIWAFSFGIIKGNLTGIDSNFVSFARLVVPFLIFFPFLRLKNINLKLILKLTAIGMLQYGAMYITYIYSFHFLKAYEVALFTILTPLYVTLIDNYLHKHFYWVHFCTTFLAIIGAAIVDEARLSENTLLIGFLFLQISNFCFAFGQIYYKKVMADLPEVKDINIFGLLYLGAALITALATLVFTDISVIRLNQVQVFSLLYLGVIASGIGFFLWNIGARKVNAGALAVFNNLKIPFAIAVSLIFFRETTSLPNLILGGSIIVSALVVNEWGTTRLSSVQQVSTRRI
jgi:drug/metabolite transporter (DMT)-like permease